jgi:hypothetical protein
METEKARENPKAGKFDYTAFEREALEQLKAGKSLEGKLRGTMHDCVYQTNLPDR